MQAIGRQLHRAPDGVPVHYERRRPELTTLYRLHAETFFAEVEATAGASLPAFVKDEFDAFVECGVLAHGFLRLLCGDCGHDKARRLQLQAPSVLPIVRWAAHVSNRRAPGRPRHSPSTRATGVLSLPIPLRLLVAAQPRLLTPVLQAVHRVFTRFLLKQTGLKASEAGSGAVTLIQRFGSAANLNIYVHCLAGRCVQARRGWAGLRRSTCAN